MAAKDHLSHSQFYHAQPNSSPHQFLRHKTSYHSSQSYSAGHRNQRHTTVIFSHPVKHRNPGSSR